MTTGITIEVAPGELVDKITILEIKAERIADAEKLANVQRELAVLTAARDATVPRSPELDRMTAELRAINEVLWNIEDQIRDFERDQDFGEGFIALARSVYRTNDRRAEVKREINLHLGSTLIEEKSYSAY
ncbi:MAG: DUF6165 family protein [Pseudomonadota bacterium]